MHERLSNQNAMLEEPDRRSLWTKIHIIALVGFLIRLILVFVSDQINYPDEIFQYLEQAHRLEFGYGVIPWEYRYGIRSWILPGLFFGLLHILHALHLDDPNSYIPIIKILLCILSISLIYSSYFIVRNIASENAGRLASLLMCFWYELIYYSSKPTPEVLSAYLLIFSIVFVVVRPTRKNAVLFGFLSALSLILRFQYLPAVFILMILAIFRWDKKDLLIGGIVFVSTIAFAGYIDYLTWGSFFASYYNSYLYNSIYKVSELFGVQSHFHYIIVLARSSIGLFLIFGFLSLLPSKINKTWLLLLCILAIILPHSLIPHKEYRFIFAAIPLFLMLMAIIISDFMPQIKRWKHAHKKILLYFLSSLICLQIANALFLKIPFPGRAYSSIIGRSDNLSAFLFLHKEPDLVAVSNDYSEWYQTGGYYYLHRNVPIYYPDHLKTIQPDSYKLYVSHIMCNRNHGPIPNFRTVFRSGDLEIRKVVSPPDQYIHIDVDTVNILQSGVDGNLPKPTFTPRLN
jgi:GPI mannosyltransferase 3